MMKRLFVLLLICLVLSGCASQMPPRESGTTLPTETAQTKPAGLYEPDSTTEAETMGAVKKYSLSHCDPLEIYAMGQDLILLAKRNGTTVLQKLSGAELYITQTVTLGSAFPEAGSLQVFDWGLACYDAMTRETVVLDTDLQECRRIRISGEFLGAPLLSEDGTVLYYCTSDAIRALEPDTGISRVLKEISGLQRVTALHFSGKLLQCTVREESGQERTLFVSTENGRLLREWEGSLILETLEDRYYARFTGDNADHLVFGEANGETRMLIPKDSGAVSRFFPKSHTAATLHPEADHLRLEVYDLASGRIFSCLTLSGVEILSLPVTTGNGIFWLPGYDTREKSPALYRWDTTATATDNETVYTGAYYSRKTPDREGLARCRQYAAEISGKYGLEVLIASDDSFPSPAGHTLEYEHLVPRLMTALDRIDAQLANYPQGFLQTLSGHFSGIRIAIVRGIAGGESVSPDALQFWKENTACIALTTDSQSTALYRELCRLAETVVITKSNAYDRWEKLNPSGFSYLCSLPEDLSVMHRSFLQEGSRSFTDAFAMISPAEDRARLMEQAMSEGKEGTFRSLAMQSKLLQLCMGIREAFGLKKSPETFLWEQYLNTSLAYTQ